MYMKLIISVVVVVVYCIIISMFKNPFYNNPSPSFFQVCCDIPKVSYYGILNTI